MIFNVRYAIISCGKQLPGRSCETPFCSSCIETWLSINPGKCPMKCEQYIERTCSRFIGKQLAKLQITCIYQQNGCQQGSVFLSQSVLDLYFRSRLSRTRHCEKHEAECGYQMQQCPGCRSPISKKDFPQHEIECALIEVTCPRLQNSFISSMTHLPVIRTSCV